MALTPRDLILPRDLKFDSPLLKDPAWVRQATAQLISRFPHKVNWFLENGYNPHFYQLWSHCAVDEDDFLMRFRSLVAGRRGGKSLGAAWESAYYLLNPAQWWLDVRGEVNTEDAWWWFLAKDHKQGLPGLIIFRQVLAKCGLQNKKDYIENKQDKFFEFEHARIDFRSAEDPSSLVGAGLNGIWGDEFAKIPTNEAWEKVRPCLSDKLGIGLFTTTPEGKNWMFEEFHADDKKSRSDISRIEYRSIDNPYFPSVEWAKLLKEFHPLAFQREYMASFDAFAGRDLPGEWLEPFYTWDDLPRKEGSTGNNPGDFSLNYYIGIDPAISMAHNADYFAISVIGIPKDSASQAYLIEAIRMRLSFAEQLELIRSYQAQYRPMYIGIENVAYQRVLVEQAARLDNAPNVIGIPAPGSKPERIISMSPSFRANKVHIRGDHKEFIDEWLNFDTTNKNAQDDILDSVEIALRTAGFINEDPIELRGVEKALEHPQKWIFDAQPKEINLENLADDEDADAYSDILDTADDWYLYE